MRELMVDIETMGTNKDAPIIQIGAVYFSMKTGETGDEYLINIDLADAIKWGAKPDGRTIEWWMHQSKEARDGLLDPKPEYEERALADFNNFWSRAKRVWSHATFDFVMLIEAMRRRDINPLCHYRKARDIRTLTGLVGMTREQIDTFQVDRAGVHHNGLDDALHQVSYCCEAYNQLKGESDGTQDKK